jgi:purine-nucleoside phosphorylase
MSIHIGAKPGDIAPSTLLPGDPLRAKYIAETFLHDATCFNEVRGMMGYTGTAQGRRISVMGTGMGIPSHSIYVHELIREYGVQTLIRVGTCGALQEDLNIGDLVLAMSASTDSHVNRLRFHGMDFAPTADFDLLMAAHGAATSRGTVVRVGNVLTSDTFYDDDPNAWKRWASYGVLAVEMETAALYTLAAKFNVRALAILTVSDHLSSGARATSEQRERGFTSMIETALSAAT